MSTLKSIRFAKFFLMEDGVRLPTFFFSVIAFFATSSLEAVIELQPHRAYYTISMMGRPASSLQNNIVDIRGTMMIEVNKTCEGWATQQLSEVWHYHDDETVEHIRWGDATFENEEGDVFKFHTFRKVNDELVEDIQGQIKKSGKYIEAVYEKPKRLQLKLPEGTLLPIQHTKALLEAAEKGEKMFPRIVFDGTTTEGASEINTFIGAKKISADMNTNKGSQEFAGHPFWPVRFAVYGIGGTEYEPEYITTQELRTDGIIKQYTIDDGTNKIQGVLVRVELLNKEGC